MNKTPIEWTVFTANPLRYRDPDGNVVHACIHKSAGCIHCYAEALAPRYGRKGLPFTAENMKRLTPFLDENELRKMLTYKPAAGKMCFVGDMTDVFGEWVPVELLEELFAVFALRSDVIWQVLTKRADRMQRILTEQDPQAPHFWARVEGCAQRRYHERTGEDPSLQLVVHGPLPNVWLGVSAEDQKNADERIPLLLNVPAAIRFVSYEPALGPIDFRPWLTVTRYYDRMLDWILLGGESGPDARPFNTQWASDVITQCQAARVACFTKQLGAKPYVHFERNVREESPGFKLPIQQLEVEEPIRLKDRKGGTMGEWPEDLRVRQWPARDCT